MTEIIQQTEKRDGEPEIELTIFYAPHRTAEDTKGREKLFGEADVYVSEGLGWTDETLESLNEISRGERPPDSFFQPNGFKNKELRLIAGSLKPIVFCDIPEGHPLVRRIEDSFRLENTARRDFYNGNFDRAMTEMRDSMQEEAEAQREREAYMESQIRPKIEDVVRNNPTLQNKTKRGDKIKVLMGIGALHTPIYQDLKKEKPNGVEPQARFNELPYVFRCRGEALRRYRFGKEVGDELVARSFIDNIIGSAILHLSDSTALIIRVSRRLAGKLSLNDIREISKTLGYGGNWAEELERRGIKIPKTEEELKAIDKGGR